MRLIDFGEAQASPIELFESVGASSVDIGHGKGDVHVYAVHFKPGGSIGQHPTGFAQLILVVHGSGWVAGADGVRHAVASGQGAELGS